MSVFVHAQGIKNVHAGGEGVKNGKIRSTQLLNDPLFDGLEGLKYSFVRYLVRGFSNTLNSLLFNIIHYFPESEGECVNDYETEIIPDYNVIESGNCGMKFECADGTCIDAEGKNFSLFSYLH